MFSPDAQRERGLPPEQQRVLGTDAAGATDGQPLARPRGLTIAAHLLLFAAALLIPVFVLAASALALFLKAQLGIVRLEAEQRVGAARGLVSRQFERLQQTAQVLAGSALLQDDDLGRFRNVASVHATASGFRLLLMDVDERVVVVLSDSGGPPDSTMLDPRLAEAARQGVSQHGPHQPSVIFTQVSERIGVFTSLAPVTHGGTRRYVVASFLATDLLSRRLRESMPDGTVVMVADRRGVVVARTDGGALGVPARDWLPTNFQGIPGNGDEDESSFAVAATANQLDRDWTIAVRFARSPGVPAQRALALFGIAGVTLIGFGTAAALVFARRITHSVHSLATLGIQLVHDPLAPPLFTPVTEVNEVGRTLADAAETRRELEHELRQASKMDAVGRLTAGIAHDFNNLLTIIIGNLEMLAERRELTGNEKLLPLLADAQESATLSANLVSQLLAFGRRETLNPVIADIGEVLQKTSRLLARTLGETIEMKLDAQAGLRARVDVPQFETVILNLAINARDAMPCGGTVNITARRAWAADEDAARLRLPVGRYVAVAVTDTGTGMTKDVRERAFDPFFTTKPLGVGTGLGLSVVYGFARQSGGDAWIRSQAGQGTTVEVWIPEAGGLPAIWEEAIRTAPAERIPGAEVTVLVVDDNASVRKVAARALRLLGFVVFEAGDGRSALEVLRREPNIDVLFTDVVMPGRLTGLDVAREAVALKPEIAVLYTSGYADSELEQQTFDDKVRWLRKPYTKAQLAAAMEALLQPPVACGIAKFGVARKP